MLRIKVTISTFYVGCTGSTDFLIEEEEWDNMSEEERNEMCWEYAKELVHWNYEVSEYEN